MRFIVENFGPIEKADIKVRDLNIFIGKNATGKSYLAYLIWCLLSVEPDWDKLKGLIDKYVPDDVLSELISGEAKEDELNKLSQQVEKLIVESFKSFNDIWGRNLENLIRDTFMVDDLTELIRIGKDYAKIILCNNNCTAKIEVNINERGLKTKVDESVIKKLIPLGGLEGLFVLTTKEKGELFLHMNINMDSDKIYVNLIRDGTEKYSVLYDMIGEVFYWIFDGYIPYYATFIAPDGRDGLIRSREVYLHALLSNVVMNEVDKRFMRFLESLYPKTKSDEISKIANFIEEKLGVEYVLRRGIPRYILSIGDLEIPIQKAPSGYKEIAPLIYAIKFGLDEGYTIIVEEPEAHLHPDAQVIVTRALAKLSKYCHVILTTHSITVLDEISNLLRVNNLSEDEKRKLRYDENEGLKPENVGIYLFSDGNVEEVEVYEDGIEETELDKVVIEIANLHTKVADYYEHSRRLQTQK